MLANEITAETRTGFDLRNGISIEILAGDFRLVRGFTLVAAVVDEVAFLGLDEEAKVKSDAELVRALKPALATCGGKLIGITSPYARKGWCWKQYTNNFGNDAGRTLVWNCPSRTMNPKLPQRIVDEALAEDLAAAKSEYLGEFRDDVGEYLPRAVVEALVIPGRTELLPLVPGLRYFAFTDVSGGRGDDATLGIAHRSGRKVVLDLLRQYRPPFNPHTVVREMCDELKRYRVPRVTGDNYSAEWCAQAFNEQGVAYVKCDKPKSQLYVELLPRLCSGEIELLDIETLINQLANLERRTRSGGKDVIDHPPGGHDDVANAVAGVADVASMKLFRVGGLRHRQMREVYS